ncbi:MAG: MFS transporter [Anaerolineales bacterium]|nr:MAG: MFS transporter [Anaerolineales bacterium]
MSDQTRASSGSPNHLRFNATVNILDGAFFGFALGFASFTTIIPLFVSQLTDSAILIGLAPAIHTIGWQLPQLFTAGRVRRLTHYKPMVLAMTIHERLPFVGLALLAWFLPGLERKTALALVFILLIWQGFGGGWTAAGWQSMIAKIIPASWRGGFLGVQMSAVNLMASATAVLAGLILERYTSPFDFTLCFSLAGLGMLISFIFLGSTREEEHIPTYLVGGQTHLREDVRRIITRDLVFRRFMVVRIIFQVGLVAFSYYSVYAFSELGVTATQVGWLTGILIFGEVIFNLIFGALGDRKGHWLILFLGTLAALLSAILAGWVTAIPAWFVIFVLAGMAYVIAWTTTMVLSLGFGDPSEQAAYIGLSNTLLAPATLISPFLAGWCIEAFGYPTMFRASAGIFLVAAVLSFSLLRLRTIANT